MFFVTTYSTSMLCMLLTHTLISIGYCRDPLCFVNGNGPTLHQFGDWDVVVLSLRTWPDLPWKVIESKPVWGQILLQHLFDLWFWSSNMPFPKPIPFWPTIAVGVGWLILWQTKGQHSQQVECMWEEWMREVAMQTGRPWQLLAQNPVKYLGV